MRNIEDIMEDLERTGSSGTKALVRELRGALKDERARWTNEVQEQQREFKRSALVYARTPNQTPEATRPVSDEQRRSLEDALIPHCMNEAATGHCHCTASKRRSQP